VSHELIKLERKWQWCDYWNESIEIRSDTRYENVWTNQLDDNTFSFGRKRRSVVDSIKPIVIDKTRNCCFSQNDVSHGWMLAYCWLVQHDRYCTVVSQVFYRTKARTSSAKNNIGPRGSIRKMSRSRAGANASDARSSRDIKLMKRVLVASSSGPVTSTCEQTMRC